MKFEGYYTGNSNGKLYSEPIFSPKEKIIVFDMEGVLDLQKGNYKNGRRNGADKYIAHTQTKTVLKSALVDFDRVVLWSTSSRVLSLRGFPYDEVDQRIAGAQFIDEEGNLIKDSNKDGEYIKNLVLISRNLENVVAIEDGNDLFRPIDRVLIISPHGDLAKVYRKAREMIWKKRGVRVMENLLNCVMDNCVD